MVARRKVLWISYDKFLLLNTHLFFTFQLARWLPNHLQYPPLGQVWSHGNWTRIGNCWENQEHARASPRWKKNQIFNFFFLIFNLFFIFLRWTLPSQNYLRRQKILANYQNQGLWQLHWKASFPKMVRP